MNKIVLARYLEPIDWVVEIPQDFEVHIYNKGDAITSPAVRRRAHRIVERPNAGRESETYLFHMMTETEDNDDFTVYAQADPFTHSPDFLQLLRAWRQWDDLQPLSWQWKGDHEVPPSTVLRHYEQQLAGRLRVRPERFSLYTWAPIEFFDVGAMNTGRTYRHVHGQLPEGINIAAHFLRMAQLPELAEEAEAHSLGIFTYGALFAARNHVTKQLPLEAAKRLYQASLAHPCYGYVLERMWLHFFGAEFELPQSAPARSTSAASTSVQSTQVAAQSALSPSAPTASMKPAAGQSAPPEPAQQVARAEARKGAWEHPLGCGPASGQTAPAWPDLQQTQYREGHAG
ncbi:hypothetical protein [Rhizobium sp. CSW-27]|uniref:hypothetical protein n=1 Tax=Rhizobium sp. CSW-27 TaxID=2839985 RepID=UPI001C00F5C3|nr:hypothetical protein [Rhizobium sp. CSW-27]MBT9371936.1 hypothetical protein [Rhizobium sp. CSW-27]